MEGSRRDLSWSHWSSGSLVASWFRPFVGHAAHPQTSNPSLPGGYSHRMGIWDRVKATYREAKAAALEAGEQGAKRPGTDPPASLVEDDSTPHPVTVRVESTITRTPHVSNPAVTAHYAAERRRAAAAGQTVKGYRAGYMPAAEAKALLVPDEHDRPPLRLVRSNNGLDLAALDGRLVDYNILALRHFDIFAFRAVGMSYHEDPDRPFTFRNGQPVGVLREPTNEHDSNAVALTTGRPARKFGYVNKQRAKWVAERLDNGQALTALVIQSKAASPRVLITTPEMLAYLRRE